MSRDTKIGILIITLIPYGAERAEKKRSRYNNTVIAALAQHLPSYDNGYWSYYNSQKRLSSPFYYSLHISQLEALCLISHEPVFKRYHQQWTILQDRFINKTRVSRVKVFQKLKEPPRITIVR